MSWCFGLPIWGDPTLFYAATTLRRDHVRAPHSRAQKGSLLLFSTFCFLFLFLSPLTHWASQYDPPLHLQPMAVTAQLFLAQQPLYLLKYSHSFFALVFRRSRPSLVLIPSRLSSLSSSSRPHSLTSFVTLSNRPLNWLAFWLISGSRFKHLRDINVPSPPRQLT
jgi:hypothetical protein